MICLVADETDDVSNVVDEEESTSYTNSEDGGTATESAKLLQRLQRMEITAGQVVGQENQGIEELSKFIRYRPGHPASFGV